MTNMKRFEPIFEVAEKIYRIWERIPKTKILNQEATIRVPENVVDYSLAVSIPKNFRSIQSNVKINAPSITRASASSLYRTPKTIRGAMKSLPSGEGYVLYPKLLPSDSEIISLNVSYAIGDISLVEDLVERTWTHDPGGAEKNEYWIHAQLKHPKVLDSKFGRFDIREVDVTVDVAVHNELRTSIPSPFVRRLKIFFDLLSETDPRQQFRVIPQLRSLAREKTAGQEFKILKNLEGLFLPRTFSKFVDVIKDFRYSTCYKGKEFYDLPIEIIPKKMEIVSRTDLSLEKFASEGILTYKRDALMEAIKAIFFIK